MTTSTPQAPMVQEAQGWFQRAEAWLDARGKGAWIAAMVLASSCSGRSASPSSPT
jgi:hypothetical protein